MTKQTTQEQWKIKTGNRKTRYVQVAAADDGTGGGDVCEFNMMMMMMMVVVINIVTHARTVN